MKKLSDVVKHDPINEEHRPNLEKLAKYLLSGKLKAEFEMTTYAEFGHTYADNCGTVGCAVGHGPYAGIKKKPFEDWVEYRVRCFAGRNSSVFDFLFSGEWSEFDNTPQGAGKRIMYALEHGVPHNYEVFFNNYIEKFFKELQEL